MCKVELRAQCLGDEAMAGKLPSVVRGRRVNTTRQRLQKTHDGLSDFTGAFVCHLANHRQAGFSLAQGNQHTLVTFADDGVEFPVSRRQRRSTVAGRSSMNLRPGNWPWRLSLL